MKQFIPYFIIEQFQQKRRHGHFDALTMFVDLSGFTRLTEAFMQQGVEGAEQLSIKLNGIFAPMVEIVYARGGFIPYFAGDAFTAIFPTSSLDMTPEDLFQTALDTKQLFEDIGIIKTPLGDFDIGIKIGLSAGNVEWGIVGENTYAYFFRGSAIEQCAQAQILAHEQEIVFDKNIQKRVPKELLSYDIICNEPFFLLKNTTNKRLSAAKTPIAFDKTLSTSEKKILTQFLPPSVLRFSQIGEFRSVISIFISFKNVATYDLLHQFATIVLHQIQNFSGYFKEIDFGDKGGVMVAFFGAPISFENNIERALEFALAIEEDTKQLRQKTQLQYRIGITYGTAFTGNIGGDERVQYAVVGTQVNLAARLMTYADWGEVSVDTEVQSHRSYAFQHKGDIQYKGIQGNIPTYSLIGIKDEQQHLFKGKMIGRLDELNALKQFSLPLWQEGNLRMAYIYGEAGIGKSRLIYEFMQQLQSDLQEKNPPEKTLIVKWVNCQADQILQKPFNPFIYFLKNYFQQSPQNKPHQNFSNFEQKHQNLLERLQQNTAPEIIQTYAPIIQELERTKTILAALVGLNYENSLWQQLDAKGRYQNTLTALSNLLIAESYLQTLIIELEDAHWFDGSSKAFLDKFVQKIQHLPILLLITSRYLDDGTKPTLVQQKHIQDYQIPVLELDLNMLSAAALKDFAQTYLKGQLSTEFFKLLQRTTNGNPFYLEQILDYFLESNLLQSIDGVWHIKDKNIKLSNSINAILMARVDRLSALVKETVKAAAVIGREFEVPVLSEVLKAQEVFAQRNGNMNSLLQEQIQTAERGQIWRAMNELRYIFKHSLLREAVYDMQLRTRLRELHQLIAQAIEKIYANRIEERYVDLAFHYEQAEVWDKTKQYLIKSAQFAERNFQNQQALRFYDKMLALLDRQQEQHLFIKTLLKRGSILENTGDWENCELSYTTALENAMFSGEKILEARANNSLGKLLMLKGFYEEARHHLETAAITFESIEDQLGIAKSYGNLGNLFFRQGQYEKAKDYFLKSIGLSRNLAYNSANATIVSNLGLTYMNQGNFTAGIHCQEEQLALATAKNDKSGMATLYTNLGIVFLEKGDYDSALTSFEKGLALSRELGNKLLVSIAIGCIGSVYERKGNYEKAQENFEYDLVLSKELGDKQGIAIVHGLLGDLYALKGDFQEATPHLEEQLSLCEDLGYQKGIAKALNSLGDVHSFQGNYTDAILYYDKAIQVTREIDNKLVLGTSLVEKAFTLLRINDVATAVILQQEAYQLAKQLGNPDLLLDTEVLAARLAIVQQQPSAIEQLKALQAKATSPRHQAGVYYEWSKMDASYRTKALALYQELYKATPKYLFRLRIQELQK